MSVIVKNSIDKSFRVFVKGSPEKIKELSVQSKLPEDYDYALKAYTEAGYRVLGIGYKYL